MNSDIPTPTVDDESDDLPPIDPDDYFDSLAHGPGEPNLLDDEDDE